jgi:hypothetical protein
MYYIDEHEECKGFLPDEKAEGLLKKAPGDGWPHLASQLRHSRASGNPPVHFGGLDSRVRGND